LRNVSIQRKPLLGFLSMWFHHTIVDNARDSQEDFAWLTLPQELQLVLFLETTGRSTRLVSHHRMFAQMQDRDLYK
jgi:hypothetical protein